MRASDVFLEKQIARKERVRLVSPRNLNKGERIMGNGTACARSKGYVAKLGQRLSDKLDRPVKQHSALVATVAITVTLGLVAPASAQEFSGVLQNIVDMLTGETARLLAVLGVIIIGFLWIFGYLDLRRAAIVVAGIVVLFSAEEIVSMITGA